ncbi:hypothetical protein C0J45_14927 [Silurus meridionalis]|uniref:Uncharacterized protein n=1 Tax=Silurus meridionalis TaxID=175797 RepID=A0A8T0APV2_SILME|nr:hypothetical protein HF521_006877 [Silurus meridionalis]KAI5094852.1 hypothetical protein C0J45_14927 [Silurus meridionalis]
MYPANMSMWAPHGFYLGYMGIMWAWGQSGHFDGLNVGPSSLKQNCLLKTVSKKELETALGKWFTNARDREGNRALRAQRDHDRRAVKREVCTERPPVEENTIQRQAWTKWENPQRGEGQEQWSLEPQEHV